MNDILSIVYRYKHRDFYNHVILEYKSRFVSNWHDECCYFSSYYTHPGEPVVFGNEILANYRIFVIKQVDNFYKKHAPHGDLIFNLRTGKVTGKLPPNY
jgi:hypothetical protein